MATDAIRTDRPGAPTTSADHWQQAAEQWRRELQRRGPPPDRIAPRTAPRQSLGTPNGIGLIDAPETILSSPGSTGADLLTRRRPYFGGVPQLFRAPALWSRPASRGSTTASSRPSLPIGACSRPGHDRARRRSWPASSAEGVTLMRHRALSAPNLRCLTHQPRFEPPRWRSPTAPVDDQDQLFVHASDRRRWFASDGTSLRRPTSRADG